MIMTKKNALTAAGLAAAFVFGAAATTATAQSGTLDQQSPMSNASYNLSASTLVWQQQIRAGIDGQLEGFELTFSGPTGAQIFIEIRMGDAWSYLSPVYTTSYTKTTSANELVYFDTTGAGIFMNAGDTFSLHTYGNDTGMNLIGNYVDPTVGPPLYDEPLWLNESVFVDGWRHGFNTYVLAGGGGVSLTVNGTCPGQLSADVTGATPNGNVALIYARNTGSVTIPSGVCAGTQLGLDNSAMLVDTARADANGEVTFSGNAPSGACGGYVQALDLSSCDPSNVEQL
ncbi:MAG: hypothetical protein ACF8PN_05545 [Phycisphaerales bacterium]